MKTTLIIILALNLSCACAQSTRTYKSFSDTSFQKGDLILAPRILFHNARFHQTAYDSVKVIADFLKKHPNLEVEIGVYSDCRGNDVYNKKHTYAKANAVVNYLNKECGIPIKQIVP
ncbi:MAG TPA: OmpA family protein [Flavobacteriales bacterium]|nr:OmpA family protein [Flavobacteriales bacterium]